MRRYEGVTNPSEVGRQVRETFLPLISEIPGFVAYYLVDAGGGVVISTSVFREWDRGSDPAKVPVIRNFVPKFRVFYELSDSFLPLKLGS